MKIELYFDQAWNGRAFVIKLYDCDNEILYLRMSLEDDYLEAYIESDFVYAGRIRDYRWDSYDEYLCDRSDIGWYLSQCEDIERVFGSVEEVVLKHVGV